MRRLAKDIVGWTMLAALGVILASAVAFASTAPVVDVLGPQKAGISTPLRVTGDDLGNLFVSDPREGGVLKFDPTGKLVAALPISAPGGVARTESGELLVSQGSYVSVFSPQGVEQFKLGQGVGQFKLAKGIAVDDAGYIYVVDSLDYCVQIFNSLGRPVASGVAAAGKPANSFGTFGLLPNQFYRPTGITFEKASKQLAVVDSVNGRVEFFSTKGEYIRAIGSYGAGPMKFTTPHAVAFEYNKDNTVATRMYVVDSYQGNVQVIDPAGNGTFLRFIGSYGPAVGQLEVPTDAFFDVAAKRLVVTNSRGYLTMFGIDGGGTESGASSIHLSIDTIPVISTTSTVVSGQVSPGASVTVNSAPAVVTGTTWYYQITGLTQGEHVVVVKATDDAGGSTTATTTITVDIAVPTLTVNPVVSVTNVSSQEISGTVAEGATLTVSSNTSAYAGPVQNPTPTTWRVSINGLVSGENRILFTATKGGGVATTEVNIRLDKALLQVSALSDGSVTTAQTQNVSGTVSSIIARVSVNQQELLITNGRFSTPVVLNYGENQIVVVATDRHGNSFTDQRTIYLDPTMPTIAIDTPADGALTRTGSILVSGTTSAGSLVTVNGKAALMTGTSWSVTVDLVPGINTIEATATGSADTSSNIKRVYTRAVNAVASASLKRTVSYNPIGVNLAITSPLSDLYTNHGSVVIAGYAKGTGTLTTSVVANGVTKAIFPDADGNFTVTVELPAPGFYDLTVVASDASGNASMLVRNVKYETEPPNVAVAVKGTQPTVITGTLQAGETLEVTDPNGNPVGNVTIDNNGKWQAVLPSDYDPTQHLVTVVSAAGNSSRSGDMNGDGVVDIVDALKVMHMALGMDKPTAADLLHTDVGSNRGAGKPDGRIDLKDVLAVMNKVVGLSF